MKLYAALLVLSLAVVHGEKKINLEDIERDNLQSEAASEQDNVSEDNTKYNSDKSDNGGNSQLQYQTEARFGGQQAQDIKYVPQVQPEAYNQNLQAYQQQEQQQQEVQAPQQFYIQNYQPEAGSYNQVEKSSAQFSYQPQLNQGLTYQSEIPIGNQIQSYQQKVATQKFTPEFGKAPRYQNVAATVSQQPLYYPNPNSPSIQKTSVQPLLHQLAGAAVKNAKIPAYTTSVNYEPKVSYQPQPQIQYVYEPQYVPTYSEPKSTQKFTYAAPAAPQAYTSSQAYSGLTYSQQSSPNTQPKLAYTQAYFIQPQLPQYYQEPAYTPSIQSNSLSYIQPQQYYIPSNLGQQLSSRFAEQQSSHSIAQNYAKIPEQPRYTLTIPQISAQSFKTLPVTHLQPVQSHSNQIYYSSGPRSLLDSYTPSHVIASADRERYRERPLHLESGFLPSKGSFVHSYNQKRKAE